MNELVKVTGNKELVVSLEDISKGTDIKYNALRMTIQNHYRELMENLPKGNFKQKITLNLTEEQAYKLLMLLPNSEKVKKFKFMLIDEFFKMREFIQKGFIVSEELKQHIETFLPKDGYMKENSKGEIKTKPVRGYYRVDKNSTYNQLINKRYQLQKRVNSLLREDYEIEIKLVEAQLKEIEELENV